MFSTNRGQPRIVFLRPTELHTPVVSMSKNHQLYHYIRVIKPSISVNSNDSGCYTLTVRKFAERCGVWCSSDGARRQTQCKRVSIAEPSWLAARVCEQWPGRWTLVSFFFFFRKIVRFFLFRILLLHLCKRRKILLWFQGLWKNWQWFFSGHNKHKPRDLEISAIEQTIDFVGREGRGGRGVQRAGKGEGFAFLFSTRVD